MPKLDFWSISLVVLNFLVFLNLWVYFVYLGKPAAAAAAADEDAADEDSDASCLYCTELWSKSIGRWIQCQSCQQWAHLACAGASRRQRLFTCELCL
jgi:hypothetical protein